MNKKTRNILIGAGALLLIFIIWYFISIVSYIIISSVLSMIGRPIVRWLRKVKIWKIKFGSTLSALITLIGLWAFFFSLLRFLIPLLASEFDQLASIDINEYLRELEVPLSRVSMMFYGEPITLTNGAFLNLLGDKFISFFKVSQITDLFGTIAGMLGNLLIGLFSVSFITFFFLRDETMFRNGILMIVPDGFEERVQKILSRISYLLRRYFIGLILEILMVMALDTLGLTIVGLNFSDAIVIGMLCGLFNVIPYLGPWIGATAGILIALAININVGFMSQILPLIGFMILVFAAVQIIDNILFQPLIYSSSVKAHPLEIFLVIMAAGSLAGITGMILAIPVYTIFRVFGAEFLSEVKFIRKLTANMEQEIERKHH